MQTVAPLQQGFDPAGHTLAVAVQEGQYVSRGVGGADEPGAHQPLALIGTDETHALQIADVVCQLALQIACKKTHVIVRQLEDDAHRYVDSKNANTHHHMTARQRLRMSLFYCSFNVCFSRPFR